MRRPMTATWLVFVLCATAALGNQRPAPDQPRLSYDEFLKLDDQERESVLSRMSVEQRIVLRRAHAERWLEQNRPSLTASQVAVVTEAIQLLSPERYRNPSDPELIKQEERISHRLACSLGERRALAAFTFRSQPTPPARSWSAVLDSWAEWLVECVMS
jgi:hypothetical protein